MPASVVSIQLSQFAYVELAPRRFGFKLVWMPLLLAALALTLINSAYAQSPAPLGGWRSRGGASFYMGPNGACAYTSAQFSLAGWCGWTPTYMGGVLTLYGGDEDQIEYNVMWIDSNRFSTFREEFYRR